MRKIGLTLLTAFVGGAMAIGTYKVFENKEAASMSFEDRQKVYFASNKSAAITSSAGEVDFTQAAAAVTPAVVYIRTTYSAQAGGGRNEMEDLFGQMFGQRAPRRSTPQMASGSGVIISPDGYIVTNNHVVEKADKISVTTNDHRTFQAKVIGTDPNTDLALIKVTATNLPIVKLGNSDDVRVGEWVLAVGNPFNLTSTVTAGIVSAKGRNIGIIGSENDDDDDNGGYNPFGPTRNQQAPRVNKAIESFIQTDAAINPGNSGGALVNTRGELIGINSAIASHTGSYEGYGFAIPINLAKKVLDDIEKYGSVRRGYIGVNFRELNEDVAQDLGIKNTNGLYVNDVVPGGGAEAAGIRKGDVITKVEGNTIYESSDLQERVGRLQPGDKIHVTVVRDGAEKNFAVTLKSDAGNTNRTAARSKSAEELYNKLGASFQPLTAAQKAKFHVTHGVIVTQVRQGGFFDETETPVGSVITSINNQPINSIADIDKAITNIKNGMVKITGISPDGISFSNTFQVQ
ncbi:trypsin-like peptidase domain-containing protein [Mucilaginibacter sp. RS28]|uniref:Trypsin-like peptidase domain-containing protein n=1 Tax=Mucilaginibacter straminoryzae TaxID=2932774 RepID=A0A9X1X4N1_9SPHI|nr:trypsin-like peptidase domain-containing protein [Mucilaginibacter straminoryzae]MCJ8210863.1 trypsin-like peptidase domain-containing protein [Mucilaginibacter straminoryzae]